MDIQYIINLTLGLLGLAIAAYVIPTPKLKYTFMIAYACLVFYRLYDPSTGGPGTDWIRHIIVSTGEICFFIFITNFCKRYIEVENDETSAPINLATAQAVAIPNSNPSVSSSLPASPELAPTDESTKIDTSYTPKSFGLIGIPLVSFGSFTSIYSYGSAEGISHIFLAPVFLAVMAVVFTRIATYNSPYVKVARLFLYAYALGIMLHVGEFFLESHPLLTLSRPNQHNVEMFWYVISSLLFYYTLFKFKKMLRKPNEQQKTV